MKLKIQVLVGGGKVLFKVRRGKKACFFEISENKQTRPSSADSLGM